MIRMKEKSPFSRAYLNVKSTGIYRLVEYYRYLFDYLQQKYFGLLFDFSNEENVLLTECLMFSKPFPQLKQGPAEVKNTGTTEKSTENLRQDTAESTEGNEWRSVKYLNIIV